MLAHDGKLSLVAYSDGTEYAGLRESEPFHYQNALATDDFIGVGVERA